MVKIMINLRFYHNSQQQIFYSMVDNALYSSNVPSSLLTNQFFFKAKKTHVFDLSFTHKTSVKT